ncbi:type II toxin-antitoxin system RelE/ParE family toxin [Nitrincola schmidtii]|uniref:type II toxin-antitoxin system RelE/ParE family toxin n=1 Tax=Nitrincola schmidtii TaxID=1730894 RepID=UPI0030B86384
MPVRVSIAALYTGLDSQLKHVRMHPDHVQFKDREVRKIHIGSYEMRYEVQKETIFILRVWHTREER